MLGSHGHPAADRPLPLRGVVFEANRGRSSQLKVLPVRGEGGNDVIQLPHTCSSQI